ncbi:stalk domain-containing protein [Bacillus tianshenii]|nr:stalk domain-containing protein [Bacillus tianshenii]
MKKILLSMLFVFSLFCSNSTVSAKTINDTAYVEINVNGKFIQTDAKPYFKEQRLLIPIRSLSSMNLSYLWDNSSKTAIIQNKMGDLLVIKNNSQQAYKNNHKIEMDVATKLQNGRVFVPIRFVTEKLGYHVRYESIRNMVFITSEDYKFNKDALNQDDSVLARRAAISLPLNLDFKPLESDSLYHEYIFRVGETKKYVYYNGNIGTIVEIEDGRAVVQGQFDFGERMNEEFDQIAGKMTKKSVQDPFLETYFRIKNGIEGYKENRGEGMMTAYYEYERGTMYDTIPLEGVHTNIIQGYKDLELEGPKKYRNYTNN